MLTQKHGFSLLELMIALAIVSILTALSLPVYSTHLAHEKRLEAEITLAQLANALEQYYLANNTYQNATLNNLGFSDVIAHSRYQLAIQTANSASFTLTATPLDKQAIEDSECGVLILNSSGEKNISGRNTMTDCW